MTELGCRFGIRTYQRIQEIEDRETYFSELKDELEEQLEELEREHQYI